MDLSNQGMAFKYKIKFKKNVVELVKNSLET